MVSRKRWQSLKGLGGLWKASEALESPWKKLEAPGNTWQALETLGSTWNDLEGLGQPWVVKALQGLGRPWSTLKGLELALSRLGKALESRDRPHKGLWEKALEGLERFGRNHLEALGSTWKLLEALGKPWKASDAL